MLLLVLIVIWIVLADTDDKTTVSPPMESGESVGWLFLCIPLAGFVLAEAGTNAFFSRYFICVLPGVAVAFSCLLWRNFRKAHRVSLGIFLLLAAWGVGKQLIVARHPQSVEATGIREFLRLEIRCARGRRWWSRRRWFSPRSSTIRSIPTVAFCCCLLSFEPPGDSIRSSPDPCVHQRLCLENLSHFYPLQFWRLYRI